MRKLVTIAVFVAALIFSLPTAYSYFSDRSSLNVNITLKIPLPPSVYIVKVESGNYHSLALTSDGRVYSWGYNSVGQQGNGGTSDVRVPTQIASLSDVIDIDAGWDTSFAVTADGTVYAWGYGGAYCTGNGTTGNMYVPKAVTMPEGVKFEKVSAGGYLAMALATNGDVYAWGYNEEGQCGDSGASTRIKVPTKIDALSDIKEISMGGHTAAAIDSSGVLYTWGSDSTYGQLGDSADNGQDNPPKNYSGIRNAKYVHCSFYDIAVIDESGEVYAWGMNGYGQVGNGRTSACATPYATGVSDAKQVHGYQFRFAIVTEDGRVFMAGSGSYNASGFGNTTQRTSFTQVPALANVSWASDLYDSSSMLIDDDVYSAGYNGSFQFGMNTTGNTPSGKTHMDGRWIRPTDL